jgi:hypothetical protein
METDNISEITISRDDLLKELGSRALSEHLNQLQTPNQLGRTLNSNEYEKCEVCSGLYKKGTGISKHRNSKHYGKSNQATIGELAKATQIGI